MPLSQVDPVQCYLAMVGFSSDKTNILQHVKCISSTIVLALSGLDGMNTVVYSYFVALACKL